METNRIALRSLLDAERSQRRLRTLRPRADPHLLEHPTSQAESLERALTIPSSSAYRPEREA